MRCGRFLSAQMRERRVFGTCGRSILEMQHRCQSLIRPDYRRAHCHSCWRSTELRCSRARLTKRLLRRLRPRAIRRAGALDPDEVVAIVAAARAAEVLRAVARGVAAAVEEGAATNWSAILRRSVQAFSTCRHAFTPLSGTA